MSMTLIFKRFPVLVSQTLQDSCWAAVLHSWSRVEPRFGRRLSQEALIGSYGEGDTGGITASSKIPMIAASFNLDWTTCGRSGLADYVRQHLVSSYIFCGYSVSQFMHSVLVYYYDEDSSGPLVQFMDPDGGRFVRRGTDWLENHSPLVLMRKR
ncbi:MAG: hypothetical protein AB9873_11220 [Syntrophobacteraceae bacterium]